MRLTAGGALRKAKRWFRQRLVVSDNASRLYLAYRKHSYREHEVKQSSRFANIYHCCTQKTASTWFNTVFSDPTIYAYTGLVAIPYMHMGLKFARIEHALPRGTIGVHLYINYSVFQGIPKPDTYRGFFVLRDPRDIAVSWYFYARYTHPVDYALGGTYDPSPRFGGNSR